MAIRQTESGLTLSVAHTVGSANKLCQTEPEPPVHHVLTVVLRYDDVVLLPQVPYDFFRECVHSPGLVGVCRLRHLPIAALGYVTSGTHPDPLYLP
jgi:hypothetical protein